MHHVYQHTLIGEDIAFIDYFFRSFGYIGVAGFFFFSGYGLTISNLNTNGKYFEGFIKKRFIPIYLINAFLVFLYAVAFLIFGESLDYRQLVQSFFFGGTIVPAGWYLQELMFFYLVYWVTWKINPLKCISMMSMIIAIFPFIAFFSNMSDHWYLSCCGFAAGILFASKKEIINKCISFTNEYVAMIFSIIAIVLFAYTSCFLFPLRFIIYTPLKVYIIAPFIPICFALLSSRLEYKNIFFSFIGRFALEVYVMQGLVFLLLWNNYWQVSKVFFVFSSLPLLLLISIFVHPVFNRIKSLKK